MILKLTDTYDLDLLKRQWNELVPQIVIDTITERFDRLEEAFQTPYLKNSYGFTAVYIITEATLNPENEESNILNYYNLDKELCEYSEIVGEKVVQENVNYTETMWLQGNDTSIIIFLASSKKEMKQHE